MNHEEKFTRRRLASSYAMVIISISLMLYVLGVLLVFVVNSNSLINNLKENLGIEVIVKDNFDEEELRFDLKQLYLKPYTKQIIFTSNEEAAKELSEELDEDFVGFIGYNPLPTSFELKVHSDYSNPDSLNMITTYLQKQNYVKSISTQEPMINRLNNTKKHAGILMILIIILFAVVNIIIINNTIKLSIYSHRTVIKTMQTIGATTSFIRKPYIEKSLLQGLMGATIAVILLSLTVNAIINYYPDFELILHLSEYLGVVLLIYVFGIAIVFFTALFAVNKYLDIRTKLLY